MNYVGIDIGSTASKVVVRGDNEMYFVLPTGWSSKETTKKIKEHLKELGADVENEDTRVVATGYGRVAVDFADHVITEITCHARGGRELAHGDCAVIDVGGQDTKVINPHIISNRYHSGRIDTSLTAQQYILAYGSKTYMF